MLSLAIGPNHSTELSSSSPANFGRVDGVLAARHGMLGADDLLQDGVFLQVGLHHTFLRSDALPPRVGVMSDRTGEVKLQLKEPQ